MIDIHSHILPGMDDGSADMMTSIKMAEIAVSEGIKKMIATPHFIERDLETERELISERVDELNSELQCRSIDLEIFPGQEVLLTPGVLDLYDEGKLMTLCDGGLYILVELPIMSIPMYALETLHQLALRGLRVILAHPERNLKIAKDPRILEEFLRIGTLLQVNSLSLIGVFGGRAKRTAERIISSGMAHFIATDCHTARSRSPRVVEAANTISDGAVQLLLRENPSKVLLGERIDPVTMAYDGQGMGFAKRVSLFLNNIFNPGEVYHDF